MNKEQKDENVNLVNALTSLVGMMPIKHLLTLLKESVNTFEESNKDDDATLSFAVKLAMVTSSVMDLAQGIMDKRES